jgi:hypothetical protein
MGGIRRSHKENQICTLYKILFERPCGKHGTDLRIILITGLTEIGLEGVHWIRMVHDRDWWLTFINTAMDLRVP